MYLYVYTFVLIFSVQRHSTGYQLFCRRSQPVDWKEKIHSNQEKQCSLLHFKQGVDFILTLLNTTTHALTSPGWRTLHPRNVEFYSMISTHVKRVFHWTRPTSPEFTTLPIDFHPFSSLFSCDSLYSQCRRISLAGDCLLHYLLLLRQSHIQNTEKP